LRGQPFIHASEIAEAGLRLTVAQGDQAMPVILRALDGAGIGVASIALARPTLDDVFLKLTGRSLREAQATSEKTASGKQTERSAS
jgi:ABC-2 type transport system ATP-binding protein